LIADIIQIKTSRINSLKNMIENYRTRIETAQEKLKKLNQKLSDIKSGTFSSYLSFGSKKAQLLPRLKVKNVLKNGTKT
jgi:DNA repair ATPase RecN